MINYDTLAENSISLSNSLQLMSEWSSARDVSRSSNISKTNLSGGGSNSLHFVAQKPVIYGILRYTQVGRISSRLSMGWHTTLLSACVSLSITKAMKFTMINSILLLLWLRHYLTLASSVLALVKATAETSLSNLEMSSNGIN